MAAAWESAPLVDAPKRPPLPRRQASGSRPAAVGLEPATFEPAEAAPPPAPRGRGLALAAPAAPAASWESAPLVEQEAPTEPAGAAAIPGQAPDMQAPASMRPVIPDRPTTLAEDVVGAFETVRAVVQGAVGGLLGTGAGVVADISNMAGGGPRDPNVGPRVAQQVAGAIGYEPQTVAGQQMTAKVAEAGEFIDSIVPAMPMAQGLQLAAVGPAAAQQGLGATRQAARTTARGLGDVVERVRAPREGAPTPGTAGSAGAAGTDVATMRRERAADLPVPIELTKGQAERSFEQQRFERETAKDPEAGRPLRERYAEQNERLIRNLDVLNELSGAESPDLRTLGKTVDAAIVKKAKKADDEIGQAYTAAREAGELAEPVSTEALARFVNERQAESINAPVIKSIEQKLVDIGGATRDEEGKLVGGTLPLNDLEEIRKMVGRLSQPGTPNLVFGIDAKKLIDKATENAGGDLYKEARALRSRYAREFEDQAAVAKLLSVKPGTSDRSVALEDVFSHSVLSGSRDDLDAIRRTLITGGDEGKQGWRELRGQAVAYLRDEATKGASRDIRGNPIVSPASLNRAVTALDKDGKLELLLGKRGAEQIRDLRDLAMDVHTAPPGSVNTSNTASVVAQLVADMSASAVAGLPLPLVTGGKLLRDTIRGRKTRKQVREALGAPQIPERAQGRGLNVFRDEDDAGDLPAAEAGTAPAPPADPRLAEIDRLREGASPETLKVLDQRAKSIESTIRIEEMKAKRIAEAEQLDAAAGKTADEGLQAALRKRAAELRFEKVPAGEATELPPETGRGPDLPPLPVGKAREIELPAAKAAAEAERIPAPEVRELDAEAAADLAPTPRETELARLRAAATDPQVRKELDRRIAAERKRAEDIRRGEEYLRLADEASDPELRADFEAKAKALGARRDIPAGDAVEVDDAAWTAAHELPAEDVDLARLVAEAMEADPEAVRDAAQRAQNDGRAFEQDLRRILDGQQGQGNEQRSRADRADPPGGRGLAPAQGGGESQGESQRAGDSAGSGAGRAAADEEGQAGPQAGARQEGVAPAAEQAAPVVQLSGDEIADDSLSTIALRKAAAEYAKREFAGKSFKNEATGATIEVTPAGIKHALSGRNATTIRLIAGLGELLRSARYVERLDDKLKRPDVVAVHRYEGKVNLAGESLDVGVFVRELRDGQRYYEHFIIKKAGAGGSEGMPPGGTSGAASRGYEKLGVRPTPGDEPSLSRRPLLRGRKP